MENRTRNIWIAIAAAILVGCCCLAVIAVAAITMFVPIRETTEWGLSLGDLPGAQDSERFQQVLEVGESPVVTLDNFAGNVTVNRGERGVVEVVATKRLPLGADAEQVEIEVTGTDRGVTIKTRNQRRLNSASVSIELTVPQGTRLDLETGAGSMEVRNAEGPVRLETGAGEIDYEGAPSGDCRFQTGAGEITLRLPADLDMEVDLGTGVGEIEVEYPVEGKTGAWEVKGVVGDGSRGSIHAQTGAGGIRLQQQ